MKATTRGIFDKEVLIKDFEKVEQQLLKDGKVIIISENRSYELSVMNMNDLIRTDKQIKKRGTLIQAMEFVINQSDNKEMHAADIAKVINEMEIYVRKDGKPLDSVQVRSCANNNQDKFECLSNNIIKNK